jgi:hypothetical protein
VLYQKATGAINRWPYDFVSFVVLPKCRSLPLDLSGVFRTLARSLLQKVLACFPGVSVSHLDDHSIHQKEVYYSLLISIKMVPNLKLKMNALSGVFVAICTP